MAGRKTDQERGIFDLVVISDRAESIPENMGFIIDSESIIYSKELIIFTILWPKTVILNRFRINGNRN